MSEEKNIPSENNPAPHTMPIPAPEQTPASQPESVQQPVSHADSDPAVAPAPGQTPHQQIPAPQPIMPGQPVPGAMPGQQGQSLPPMPGQTVPMGQPLPGQPLPGVPPMPPMPGQPIPGAMPGQSGGAPYGAPFGGGPVPPPITPLVLGVLSIVFAILFALVGLVLGIIAIVSGNRQLRTYGEAFAPKAKPGRMCGIIGVVLSCVNMVIVIALMAFAVFAFNGVTDMDDFYMDEFMDDEFAMEDTESYGGMASSDEEFFAIVDGIMADIVDDEQGYLEAGVTEFIDDISEGSGHHHDYDGGSLFEAAGITAADITDALLEDASYEITSCEAIDDFAMVEVTVYAKTLMTQYDVFMSMMEEYDAENPGWDDTYENAAQVAGDIYMQSFAETEPSEIPLVLTLENKNGEWVLDDDDVDYIVNSMLYLS